MNQNNSSFSASNHSIAAYGLFPFIPLECWCKQTSKVTVLAVKQFNAEKLELFSKAHDPEHLKLSCIELNRLMATYVFALLIPIHYFAMLVLASSKVTVLAYWMKQ